MDTNNTLLDEYLFEFEIAVSEQEFFSDMFEIECGYLNESAGLIVMQEAFTDTILEWAEKIKVAVANAFEKLKKKMHGLLENQLKSIQGQMNGARPEPNFSITDYHVYDYDKLKNFSIANKKATILNSINSISNVIVGQSGDNDQTNKEQNNKTDDEILAMWFPELNREDKNIKESMEDVILKSIEKEVHANSDIIDDCWEFCTNIYFTEENSVEKDKDFVVNDLSKNITNVAKALSSLEKSLQSEGESAIISEANDTKDTKQGFKDDPSVAVNNSRQKASAALLRYSKVAVDVYSAKMKLLNNIYWNKYKILMKYAKNNRWKVSMSGKEK
jgi:hypothetical protein